MELKLISKYSQTASCFYYWLWLPACLVPRLERFAWHSACQDRKQNGRQRLRAAPLMFVETTVNQDKFLPWKTIMLAQNITTSLEKDPVKWRHSFSKAIVNSFVYYLDFQSTNEHLIPINARKWNQEHVWQLCLVSRVLSIATNILGKMLSVMFISLLNFDK